MKIIKEYSEVEILLAIHSNIGINEALQYLYCNAYKSLERFVLTNSGTVDDAADIIQDSFLVFIKMVKENKFRQESSINSYLYSITKNLWITELRKRKNIMVREGKFSIGNGISESDVTDYIIRQECHKLIIELFNYLGEKCKNVLYKFYYEELSMKEIMILENFTNEQVLRNKKHKCLKGLIEKIQADPKIYRSIKNALQHAK